jgi:two-component system, OmpR family, sensor kinase
MSQHDSDAGAMRRAARTVGLRVTLVSAALVVLVAGAAMTFIIHESRPAEQLEKPLPGETKIYVDAVPMLVGIGIIGLGAILLAGVASWLIGRSAVRPLGTALELQRSFVADASHELRTPLAVLDARLQQLQRRPPQGADLVPALGRLRADTKALIDLTTDLLLLAEAGSPAGGTARTALAPVVQETAAAMALVAGERRVTVRATAPDDAWVAMPETSLRRALTALLDNAIAHAPEGSTVRVGASPAGRRIELTVEDEGGGIRGMEPDRVFERFAHAGEGVRADGKRGFGIGLALVRDVVVRWGGTVSVGSTSEQGTTMRLELPVAPRLSA